MNTFALKLVATLFFAQIVTIYGDYQGRIVGGSVARITDAPYQVQVIMGVQLLCGGSILTERHVMSAGHCFDQPVVRKTYKTVMRIKAGSAITNEGDAYHVTRAYRHPRYNTLTVDYDVSVIVIQGKFVASRNQIPIRLSTTEDTDTMVGEEALVTGYGRLSIKGPEAHRLLKLYVPVLSRNTCENAYKITSRMFCAGYMEGKRDACIGDSGGPLVLNGAQIGIVSFGKGCAERDRPGVYTNVAAVREWVMGLVERT